MILLSPDPPTRYTRSRLRPVDTRAFAARMSFAHLMVFYMVNICAIVAATAGAIVSLAGTNRDVVYCAVAFMALVTVCIGGYGTDSRFRAQLFNNSFLSQCSIITQIIPWSGASIHWLAFDFVEGTVLAHA